MEPGILRIGRRALVLAIALLALNACSSDSESGSSADLLNAYSISGSVGDGPIIGAEIRLIDANGELVAIAISDAQARYSVDIPASAQLPITAHVAGGIDLVTHRPADFELRALVHDTGQQTLNISPMSTLISHSAACLDDTSAERTSALWAVLQRELDIGLDTSVLTDPINGEIDSSNVETTVLANEALGEWVRRTGSGMSADGLELDEIVRVLACDLADGAIDGQLPGPATELEVRVLGAAKAAEVGVRLEVLAGRLEVDDRDATDAMNSAIRTIMPAKTDADVSHVPASDSEVKRTLIGLDALQQTFDEEQLQDLVDMLVTANPDDVRGLLNADTSADLENLLKSLPERVALSDSGTVQDMLQNLEEVPQAPLVSFAAAADSVDVGGRTRLSWAATNATRCVASGGWGGDVALQGVFDTGPLTESTSFALTCGGLGGKVDAIIRLTVVDSETQSEPEPLPEPVPPQPQPQPLPEPQPEPVPVPEPSPQPEPAPEPEPLPEPEPAPQPEPVPEPEPLPEPEPVPEPMPAPVVTFAASAQSVNYGGSVTLSWSATDAEQCSASGDWGGSRSVQGSTTMGLLQTDRTYSLTCSGQGGEVQQTVMISVGPAPEPNVALTASSLNITEGDPVTLTWSSSNANECSASGGWQGAMGTTGQQTLTPASTATFDLQCSGDGGAGNASLTVVVDPRPEEPAPTLQLGADISTVAAGDTATLTWTSEYAQTCVASGGWNGAQLVQGSATVTPQAATTYTLECSGAGGTTVAMVNISVLSQLTLQWQPPTENVDGTAIAGLNAYRIHYGVNSGQYDDVVQVAGSATSHSIDVPTGSYYVAMTAIDIEGNESGLSNEVLKQVE